MVHTTVAVLRRVTFLVRATGWGVAPSRLGARNRKVGSGSNRRRGSRRSANGFRQLCHLFILLTVALFESQASSDHADHPGVYRIAHS